MHPVEVKAVLNSMEILIDTREQPTERARRRYETFGVPFRRQTLSYGDYTYNAILPDGSPIFAPDLTVKPLCAVERKMSLDELAGCFTRSRDRFRGEFQRASENGATIFLLVENSNWENLLNGRYKSKFNPKAFAASVIAWSLRYGLQLVFCKAETSGRLIKEILYRDLKERLERGEFG